ncbi:MAG: MFS transporter [Nesterenkonia sp.]|uniref:MFS transporter n=1 Tax=Nesterenkonia marinintestina TaxID=2979865 RepID=UPI0021BFB6D2|nr:MFS transporter [Nesterenkonia sp. GX14115]MDO5492486.1 MFS transporter [Nesterenkonia sp.]
MTDPHDDPSPARPPLLTGRFVLATAVNFGFALVFYMLITGMAVYAAEQFGAGDTAAGFAASAFVVGALIGRILSGKYSEHVGRRRSILICLVVFTAASALYMVADSYGLLVALRIVHGAAFGFGQTALTAAVFAMIPASRRGEGSGYYTMPIALAPAIGPAIAIQLSAAVGFWAMFVAATVFSGLALLGALFLRPPEGAPTPMTWRQRLVLRPREILYPRAFPIALVMMLLGMAFASVIAFLHGFGRAEGMLEAASAFFLVYAVAMLIARILTGRIQDRFGDNAAMYPCLVLYLIGMGLLTWSPHPAAIIAAGVLTGFGFGSLLPVLQAVVATQAGRGQVSIAVSTFFILLDLGFGVAPLLLGALVEAFGYREMFGVCTAVVLLASGLYWLLHGRFDVRQGTPRRPRED